MSKLGYGFWRNLSCQSQMMRFLRGTRRTASIDGATGVIGRCLPSASCWGWGCYCAGSPRSAILLCDTPCLPSSLISCATRTCCAGTTRMRSSARTSSASTASPWVWSSVRTISLAYPRWAPGAFRHFVEKYLRAKRYCEAPFETRLNGKRKEVVPIPGERIIAEFVRHFPVEDERQAQIAASPATAMTLSPGSLDGVFTDPPYFANVQYAELIDFNYVWLRQALQSEFPEFVPPTTRSPYELTGNVTLGRGIEHFTEGLSAVFCHYAAALKPGAPFVFTYHHNDPAAYVPVVVAILDAGLDCTATLPVAAEMSASLHILGTKSSVLDSVFVCRQTSTAHQAPADIQETLEQDAALMAAAEVKLSQGDIRCLASGHAARVAINGLRDGWDSGATLLDRMTRAEERLVELGRDLELDSIPRRVLEALPQE